MYKGIGRKSEEKLYLLLPTLQWSAIEAPEKKVNPHTHTQDDSLKTQIS